MSALAVLERWRPVERNTAYEVSDRGRVRRADSGRVLAAATNSQGYRKLHLGRGCQVYVHQLVAEAFLGARPRGHVVDHIDFDRTNNRPANLRWLPEDINRWRWARGSWVDTHAPPDDEDVVSEAEALAALADITAAGW